MDTITLKSYIHTVADFPRPGIRFRDITPLLAAPEAYSAVITLLKERLSLYDVEAIVGIEARGFIFGAALAHHMHLPFHLVRKAGKLPRNTASVEYALEYGQDALEIHRDAVKGGQRFAVIDDVLATGGTAQAVVRLLEGCGAQVTCCLFLMELQGLAGREKLQSPKVESLLSYTLDE
ncbi:MAG: adenine phosphoribosyltransferase [Wenzhouxiangellaceae bacterium]